MSTLRIFGMFLFVHVVAAASANAQTSTFDPTAVRIASFWHFGSACAGNSGNVKLSLNDKADAFSLIMPDLIADLLGGAIGQNVQGNCRINLSLQRPKGWQLALKSVTFAGYAFAEAPAQINFQVTQSHGLIPMTTISKTVPGPLPGKPFSYKVEKADRDLVWSSCLDTPADNFALNFNAYINAGPLARVYVDFGSAEFGDANQTIQMVWRACKVISRR